MMLIDRIAVGYNYTESAYPMAYVSHFAEDTYLQGPISTVIAFERAIAFELRACFGSSVRTGNPSTQKLPSSLEWHHYNALDNYLEAPLRLLF